MPRVPTQGQGHLLRNPQTATLDSGKSRLCLWVLQLESTQGTDTSPVSPGENHKERSSEGREGAERRARSPEAPRGLTQQQTSPCIRPGDAWSMHLQNKMGIFGANRCWAVRSPL